MSDKRKKRKFDTQREARRVRQLAEQGRIGTDGEMPAEAVPADCTRQQPNNSYAPAPHFYTDKPFSCIDCGRDDTWTAQQQKWYYEVAKGSLYATAVRCRDCRKIHREQRMQGGDLNRWKRPGALLAAIRKKIEPTLIEQEFQFDGRDSTWIDYSRPGVILRCLFEAEEPALIAESLDHQADYHQITHITLSRANSADTVTERIEEFTNTVLSFVRSLPPTSTSDSH